MVRVLCRTSELKLLADETEDILYHTSSVSETLDTLLSFKKRLSEINGYSDIEEEDIATIKDTAEYLYGMIHARYIISADGLDAMV